MALNYNSKKIMMFKSMSNQQRSKMYNVRLLKMVGVICNLYHRL